MCGQRVGLQRDAVDVQLQPGGAASRAHPLINLGCALGPAKLVFQILLAGDALLRQIGVELERVPADHHVGQVGSFRQGQSGFELAFADVAPGADHVGDDIDGESG